MAESVAERILQEPMEEEPVTRRKRGRPKGYPKTGGRTKQSKDRGKLLDEAADEAVELLCSIIQGKEQRWSGPTGKSVLRRPTADEQLRASKEILSRREPVLQSVDSTFTDKTPKVDTTDKRHAARAILEIVHEANQEQDGGQIAHHEDDTPPELRSREVVHESGALGSRELEKDKNGSAVNGATSDAPTEGMGVPKIPIPSGPPEEGERHLIGRYGAQIVYTKIDGTNRYKWAAVDAAGNIHGFRRDQREAEQLAGNIRGQTQ